MGPTIRSVRRSSVALLAVALAVLLPAPAKAATTVPAALDALLAADVALKESKVSSDEQVLATLVLTLCAPDAAHDRSAA